MTSHVSSADDLIKSNGQTATSVAEFGNSWVDSMDTTVRISIDFYNVELPHHDTYTFILIDSWSFSAPVREICSTRVKARKTWRRHSKRVTTSTTTPSQRATMKCEPQPINPLTLNNYMY